MQLPRTWFFVALAGLFVPALSCSTAGTAGRSDATQARFEVEVKLITAGADACRNLDLGDVPRVVSAEAARELVDTAAVSCGIVSRPRMTVTEGSVATIASSIHTEYVKDFDADAQPLMGSVEHGVHIEATPKSTSDDRSDVTFSVEVSALHEPMRTAQLTLPGNGKTVTVQLPMVEKQSVRTSFVLGADQVAILPVRPMVGDDSVRAIVLRVRRIAGTPPG